MTEQQPVAGQPLTAEQAEFLRAQQAQQAASESAGISQAQADSAAAMTERGPLLPAEVMMEELMAQLKAQSAQIEAMSAALGSVQKQMEEAQVAAGGPLTVRYAEAARDKLAALDVQWPQHEFTAAHAAADQLVAAAKDAVKGQSQGGVFDAASLVIRRLDRRLPHIDFSAIIDDVELAVEEGLKLTAAA